MMIRGLVLAFFFVGCSSSSTKKIEKPTLNFQVSSRVLDKALTLVNLEEYDLKTMTVGETQFHILGRKKGGLGIDRIERSLILYWPFFSEQFVEHPDEAAIIDQEGAIGVKPLERFIITVYYSDNISAEDQEKLKSTHGWRAKRTTEAYAKSNYHDFKNFRQAYMDDMLTRGFGHLIFGHGVTYNSKDESEWWFSNAMANTYGKSAWHKGHRNVSPYFKDSPEDSFIQELRTSVGSERFDLYMNSWVTKKGEAEYGSFKDSLNSEAENTAEELEVKYGIKD